MGGSMCPEHLRPRSLPQPVQAQQDRRETVAQLVETSKTQCMVNAFCGWDHWQTHFSSCPLLHISCWTDSREQREGAPWHWSTSFLSFTSSHHVPYTFCVTIHPRSQKEVWHLRESWNLGLCPQIPAWFLGWNPRYRPHRRDIFSMIENQSIFSYIFNRS